MDLATSKSYAAARGYLVWGAEDDADLEALLLKAADYIMAHYRLKATLTVLEQARYDQAQFMIALDILTNGEVPLHNATSNITKEEKEGAGFRKLVEYGEQEADRYPRVTALLKWMLVGGGAGVSFGKLTR